MDEELPRRKPAHQLGEDLSRFSVEDLKERLRLARAEIERVEAEIGRREATRTAAAAIFRT